MATLSRFFHTRLGLFFLGLPTVLLVVPFYTHLDGGAVRLLLLSLLTWGYCCRQSRMGKPVLTPEHPWITLEIGLCFGAATYYQWTMLGITARIAAKLHLSVSAFLAAVSTAHFLTALPGLSMAVNTLGHAAVKKDSPEKKEWLSGVYLLIGAAGIILVCSKCSLLYPINDWMDINCFFTVGKSLLSGLLPYRDLVEQKGPLLYGVYALAALVDYRGFFGVYLLEVLCCWGTLLGFYQILKPDFGTGVWRKILLAGTLLYSMPGFTHGGSVEELCLPLLTYGMWVGIRSLRKEALPTKGQWYLMGITSGCVLWMKFTILAFYLGWIAAPLVLAVEKKQFNALLQGIGWIALGVATVSALPLGVYAAEGCLNSLWNVYFLNNITGYQSGSVVPGAGTAAGLEILVCSLFPLVILGIWGGFWAARRENRYVKLFYISEWVIFGILTCSFGHSLIYYSLALCPLAVFGIGWLPSGKQTGPVWTAAMVLLGLVLTCNSYLLRVPKDDIPQLRFQKTIAASGIENPTLLNYGFMDGGFYLTTGTVPVIPHFCILNSMQASARPAQNACVEAGKVDFVVTRDVPLDAGSYALIDSGSLYSENVVSTYYLYQRRE